MDYLLFNFCVFSLSFERGDLAHVCTVCRPVEGTVYGARVVGGESEGQEIARDRGRWRHDGGGEEE